MKNFFIIFIGLLTTTLSFAQASEERTVDEFKKIKASSGVTVEYKQVSKGQSVTVTWNADLMKYLKTEVKNNVLKIYIDTDNNYFKSLNTKNLKVVVTNPSIVGVEASSSSDFKIKGNLNVSNLSISTSSSANFSGAFTCNKVNISASSSSNINAEITSADDLNISGSSSAEIVLKGKSTKTNITCSSSSECNAAELTITDSNVTASSSADVIVKVSGVLNATATSSGTILYIGTPTSVNASKSSGGSVEKK